MIYRLAANTVMFLHYAFLVFALLGGLALWVWPAAIWWHLPVLIWGVAISTIGWTCPLTPLENRLRITGGGVAYEGGFIENYLTKRLYPDGLPKTVQVIMGALLLGINLLTYGWWFYTR
jgi:hypothetical protein